MDSVEHAIFTLQYNAHRFYGGGHASDIFMERVASIIMHFKDDREFADCIAFSLLDVHAELLHARRLDAFLTALQATRRTRPAAQSIFSRPQTEAARFWRSTLASLSDMQAPSPRL